MKPVATIILNRNLPNITDKLYNHLRRFDGNETDIFVLDSGSDKKKLSKYTTWHANWKSAVSKGLRYYRGMNYGLKKLHQEKKLLNYEAFFLISNDAVLRKKKTIKPMLSILRRNEKIGLLSPCSKRWGERKLFKKDKIKYFWFIHNHAYFLSVKLLEKLINKKSSYIDFFFDGNNFRGYGLDTEIIAKAYANNFSAAITNQVYVEENENHLINKSDLIKTDSYSKNLQLYYKEGVEWMKKKYGFENKWMLQNYVKLLYDQFFLDNPDQKRFKI